MKYPANNFAWCQDVHGGERDEITRACQVEDTHLITGTPATPDGRGAVVRYVELFAIDVIGADGTDGEAGHLGLKGTASRGGGCGGLGTRHSGGRLRDHNAREGLGFEGTNCGGGIEGGCGGTSGNLRTGKGDLAGVPGGDQRGFGDSVVTVGYSKMVDVVEMVVGTTVCMVEGPVGSTEGSTDVAKGTDLIYCRYVVGNVETLGLAGLVTRLGENGGGATREEDFVVNAGVGGQLELTSVTIFSIILDEGGVEANSRVGVDVDGLLAVICVLDHNSDGERCSHDRNERNLRSRREHRVGVLHGGRPIRALGREVVGEVQVEGATVHADGGTCGNVDSGSSGPLNSQTVQHRWRDSELTGDRDGLIKFEGIEVIGPFSRPSVRSFETHDEVSCPAHGRRHEGAHDLTRGGSNHDTAYKLKVGDAQTAVHTAKLTNRGLHQRLRWDLILRACSVGKVPVSRDNYLEVATRPGTLDRITVGVGLLNIIV
ncbi:uncharacterized protein N7503_004443 [Penicillium pulvis]|uniref:uncharacterized protein n=1 Tax=Penicillium pulvis TaxID=1562058 RepID=UPI0025469932|nr:uncharacterized protein N7503_004443 [Penicillium pulvis]KAJ5801993.1 hypothetical protein N7503_004443 [Penicillium pulvis]